jgi:DNA polymerase-3 subunit delta
MNLAEFKASTESPENVYLLHTDQEYIKKKVYETCQEQVAEAARAFDWGVFDLERHDPLEVLGAARTLPWMTPFRWIYVRNAHLGETELLEYLKSPASRTVLILDVLKQVRKWPKLPTVESDGKGNQASWIRERVHQEGYSIEVAAVDLLIELVGDDLQRLESELEKQFLWQLESKKIDADSVLRLTVEARERDVFELIGAIAGRRRDLALKILNRLFRSGIAPAQILSLLYWSFRRLLVARERLDRGENYFQIVKSLKIWTYRDKERQVRGYSKDFLADLLLKIRETDRLCKTTSLDPKLYLERVIVDTCRGRSV